jgi:hypothetical protein
MKTALKEKKKEIKKCRNMLGMIIYGILLRSKQNICELKNKKCNLRQILRAVNDLTNERSFSILFEGCGCFGKGFLSRRKLLGRKRKSSIIAVETEVCFEDFLVRK